jgi:hypothetical protein
VPTGYQLELITRGKEETEKMSGGTQELTKTAVVKEMPLGISEGVREALHREVEQLWAKAYAKAHDLSPGGFFALEREIREDALKVGGTVLSLALERGMGTGYQGTSMSCENCKQPARFVNHRGKTLFTLMHPVGVKRAYYYCGACGRGYFPLDERLGIVESLVSPGLAEAIVQVNAELPFERAEELLASLSGVHYSRRDAREMTEVFGDQLEKEAQEEIQAMFKVGKRKPTPVENPQTPERLYISPDGTTVHMEDGWKEVKVASVFTASVPVKKDEEPVRERTRYVGTTEDSQAFGRRLYVEALKQGLEKTKEVVVLADGGAWIWNEAETWLPKDRIEIIDFFHAKEKLWEVAKVVYGEGSPKAAAWAERWSGVLYKRNGATVLPALRGLRPKGQAKKEEVRKTIGYFVTHQNRMRYGYLRRHGYFIGSGVTESSCKHLVGSRLKQAGMCWNKVNVQAILQVRVALLNQRWDHLWKGRLN